MLNVHWNAGVRERGLVLFREISAATPAIFSPGYYNMTNLYYVLLKDKGQEKDTYQSRGLTSVSRLNF